MDLVTINVRGTIFMTEASNIRNILLTSPLLNLNENSPYYNPKRGEYFFDRNAAIFESVLDFFVTDRLHVPSNVCAERIREELEFWGVPDWHIEKCCWKTFFQSHEDMTTIQRLLKYIPCIQRRDRCCSWTAVDTALPGNNWRSKMWEFLNNFTSSRSAKVYHGAICVTIVLSTILLLLQTDKSVRHENHDEIDVDNTSAYSMRMYWKTSPNEAIILLEVITNGILTLTWILKFISCPNWRYFMTRFLNITDLIAWVGEWVTICVVVAPKTFYNPHLELLVIWPVCILQTMRAFRVFRLIADNCGVKILLMALRTSLRELCILLMTFSCAAIVFAILLYSAEIKYGSKLSPPNAFVAIWWAVVTMTTVGYGDYHPTHAEGYLVGIACAITGILLIALPVAVTSSNFSDIYNFSKYRACYQETLDKENKLYEDRKSDDKTTPM